MPDLAKRGNTKIAGRLELLSWASFLFPKWSMDIQLHVFVSFYSGSSEWDFVICSLPCYGCGS